MNKELKEQARKEFYEKFAQEGKVSDKPANKEGTVYAITYNNPSVSYEDINLFIDSIIDKTVQQTEERIVGKIEEMKRQEYFYNTSVDHNGDFEEKWQKLSKRDIEYNATLEQVINSLITNKNDNN